MLLILVVGLCTSFASSFTVSGLSSGGFFSTQFHVAFSSSVTGAAVIAGGPYYCSEGSQTHAETACMSSPVLLNLNACIAEAQKNAAAGSIDSLSNLEKASVYIFSGSKDTVVNPGVVKDTVQFYQKFVTAGTIVSNFTVPAEHSWVTDTYKNKCAYLGSPYMNNCNFDTSGAFLNQFYPNLKPRTVFNPNNLVTFDQSAYGDISSASMSKTGYVYIPTGCKGATCNIHIAFHGCQQSAETVGKDFVSYTGLNDWAESNNIVIIYPQLTTEMLKNPEGCWDFWGYTGNNFALKTGKQMSIVYSMSQKVPGVEWY